MPEREPSGRRCTRVLHVDDDTDFAEMAAVFLEREGFEVETATSSREGLDRLRDDASDYDCVVSDYDMPGENGLDLLDRVRQSHPELPFVLFTGKGSEEVASEAISKGVTDYVQKSGSPETYEMLARRIGNAVERRRARIDADRTRRFLETVVRHATDIIATVDTTGRIVFLSRSVRDVLGYEPDEVREQGAFGLIHPDDREAVREKFQR